MKTPRPNCYKCKHRLPVPGSAHSSCDHEDALRYPHKLDVQAYETGTRRGWFTWPFDFDPVWLIACKGFEVKAEEEKDD